MLVVPADPSLAHTPGTTKLLTLELVMSIVSPASGATGDVTLIAGVVKLSDEPPSG